MLIFKKRKYVRAITQKAIKNGHLVRPVACELCVSDQSDIEAHHVDYGKPLQVRWLCKTCHGKAHSKGHALNPENNIQTPLPIVCQKYNQITISFNIPVGNFLAIRDQSQKQNKSISSLIRDQAVKAYPLQKTQLNFNFMEDENDTSQNVVFA